MHIALATCADLPDWEVDDAPFHQALEALEIQMSRPVWDDPSVDWAQFDACLIRTTWDYTEKFEAYMAWLELVATRTRLFNPLPVVRWSAHKSYLRDLEDRGVRIVPTVWLARGSTVDLARELESQSWNHAFLKPVVGATARETFPFRSEPSELEAAHAHLERTLAQEDMMLQPFFPSVKTEGEFSALFMDGQLTHSVRKVPPPGDYRVQDDFGAKDELFALTDDDENWARSVVDSVDSKLLYARVDFLRDEEGLPHLVELELLEPSLFFRHCPESASTLAQGLLRSVTDGA